MGANDPEFIRVALGGINPIIFHRGPLTLAGGKGGPIQRADRAVIMDLAGPVWEGPQDLRPLYRSRDGFALRGAVNVLEKMFNDSDPGDRHIRDHGRSTVRRTLRGVLCSTTVPARRRGNRVR